MNTPSTHRKCQILCIFQVEHMDTVCANTTHFIFHLGSIGFIYLYGYVHTTLQTQTLMFTSCRTLHYIDLDSFLRNLGYVHTMFLSVWWKETFLIYLNEAVCLTYQYQKNCIGQSQICSSAFLVDYFVMWTLYFCCLTWDHHDQK